jgi:exopolysaccharide production protein ExoZ
LTVESNRQEIASIQMLRGIAASMVVLVHLDVQLNRHFGHGFESAWLASGVDIFFVISGFIMWVTTAKRVGITGAQFMKNRLIRIVPLYWLISAFVLALSLFAPQLLHTTVFSPSHVIASFLFLPARHPVTGDFWPLLIPGWTLNLEMMFYVLFAFAIGLSGGALRRRLLWISAFLVGALLLASLLKSRIDLMNFYTNPMILEFLTGILLGILYLSGRVRVSWFWLAAVVIGFSLLWRGNLVFGSMPHTGVAATMIVAGALFTPPFRLSPLEAIGDASYSLYLTHVIALAAVAAIWTRQSLVGGSWLFIFASVAGALVFATMSYRLVERPITAGLKKLSSRSSIVAAPIASRMARPRSAREIAE